MEQISLVLQIMEKIGVAVQPVPSERVPERIVEHISVAPQTTEKNGQVVQPVPPERIPRRVVEQISVESQTMDEQIVGVPVPQIIEDSLRCQEQIVGVPVPQIIEDSCRLYHRSACYIVRRSSFVMEAVVEVVPSTPQERVQNRTPEQIVDVPVPRTMEERVPSRIQEQIMISLCPRSWWLPRRKLGKCYCGDASSACPPGHPGDYVVFNIKGLDKLNLLRSGDVMVPALHMDVLCLRS